MKLFFLLLAAYALPVLVWVLYLAIMNLSERREKLRGFAKFNAYFIVLPIGYLFDGFLNLVVCLIFMRKPQDWLLTGTLKRYLNTDDGWRCKVAASLCTDWLDPFDPNGTHC